MSLLPLSLRSLALRPLPSQGMLPTRGMLATRRALATGGAFLVATALLTGPAVAAGGPVGGSLLGSTGVVVAAGSPGLPEVAAESWLVADLDTGEVLAAKDPHGHFAPASTLKTLTALTLIPLLDPDHRVTPSFDDIAVDGTRVGLVQEVSYPIHELFSALLMVSGNDAANVLASAAGGVERTTGLMNARAAELGALDTHAVNPHGLDATGQISSAYDLALIARAGMAEPDFARYVSTLRTSISAPAGERMEINTKDALLRDYPGALGIKNGYTIAARASFVGAAERDGRRLVVTLMKATPKVFDEAEKLLDWGFSAPLAVPVGKLVAPTEAAPAAVAGTSADGTSAVGPFPAVTDSVALAHTTGQETSLTVMLAGLGLAAAALLSVRHHPAARPAGRSAPGRSAPGTRPGGTRPDTRTRSLDLRPPADRRPDREPVSSRR